MSLLLFLFASMPVLIIGDCGCEEVWKEIASERKHDEKNFGCRSCSKPVISADAACPFSGFECKEEWQVTSNVLTPGDTCRCSDAKCAGKARLASDRNIINKMRCIDRKWTLDDDVEAEPVVCAKPCHSKICAVRNTKALPEFEALKTYEAGVVNACAVGYCEEGYTPTIINENGIHGDSLEEGKQFACTGDGQWKDEENLHKYIMCKKNPPTGCPLIAEADLATCTADLMNAAKKCKPVATRNKEDVLCTDPDVLAIMGPKKNAASARKLPYLKCDTKTFTWFCEYSGTYTQASLEEEVGKPLMVACIGAA